MATANPQGIMALPAGGAPADTRAPAQPQLGLDDSYDAVQQGLQNASPDASSVVNAELAKIVPQLDQLPDEALDQLLQIVQYMYDNPKDYAEALQDLIAQGIVEAGDFPEEHDPEFLAMFGMILMQAKKSRQGSQQSAPVTPPLMPPVGMARGGIAEAVNMVASQGRGQDTMLAHINPREAQMLRSMGGVGTLNPVTGLPEYGLFKSIGKALSGVGKAVSGAVKGVASAVKSIVSSPVGRVLATVALATFIGPTAFGLSGPVGVAAQMALASGAVTALGGGNLKDVLKSAAIGGATGFFGAPGGVVSNFVGRAVTNAAANAAITSGIVGTGMGLLTGQKLEDAVKSGITAGAISGLATGATKGFGAQIEMPKAPTVGEMLDQNRPTAQQLEGYVKPDGATSDAVRGFGEVQGSDLPPAGSDVVARMDSRQISNMPSGETVDMFSGPAYTNPEADLSSSYTGSADANARGSFSPRQQFMQSSGDSTNIGFGPGPAEAGTVGGPFDGGVTPVTPAPTFMDTVTEGYDKFIRPYTPSGVEEAGVLKAEAAGNAAVARAAADGRTLAQQDMAYKSAYEAAKPGILSTYGPVTAAGLGIAGLAGAFTPKQPEPSPEEKAMNARLQAERDRVAANPGAYVPQGLERFGIQYNDRGEIIGSQPFNPQPLGPTEVAGNYMPYTPSPYMTPSGGIGNPFIARPYNTSSMYDFMPRYAATGGIMSAMPSSNSSMRNAGGIASLARGGYPRRTGQISGPGTGTSDSIPAMLSDGEFVMTAKAVRGAGKGNRLAGAKKMYALMHQLERNAARG